MATTQTQKRHRPLKAERVAKVKRACQKRCPGLVDWLGDAGWQDLDTQLDRLTFPRWQTPTPSKADRAAGAHFDVEAVEHFLRFCVRLRHVKGRRFAGRPFVPDLWQIVFVIGPVMGWKRADGLRWYRELYLEVPRKNGKSTLAAALTLYLLSADREPGAEVVSAALDRDQARAVFDVSAEMASKSPALRRRLRVIKGVGTIVFDSTSSWYRVLSSDKGGRRKHGLNLHGAVIDELHVITDRELVETIETGTGSRDQPLLVFITTAGIPDASPLWLERHNLTRKVATRVVERPELCGVIYAADPKARRDGSWANEATHRAANPGYGVTVRPEYLKSQASKAKLSPAALNGFLRLHLGIPTEAVTGWVDLDRWDATASMVDEGELEGQPCWAGLDLASSLDLCALVLVFPDTKGKVLDVVCRFWTPEATLVERSERDLADYAVWARNGFLTTTPGEAIDYDLVEAEVVRLLDRFEVKGLNYDPWGSKQLRDHLSEAGAPLWECRQNYATLSPATKETSRLIYKRQLRHGGHPVLRYCVAGTKVALDTGENVKPDRKRSTSRIDGTVALIMAVEAWLRDNRPGRSVYEERGLASA